MFGAGWLGGLASGGQELTILIGVGCGAALCVFLLAAACGLVVYRRSKSRRPQHSTPAIRSMGENVQTGQQYWLTPQGKTLSSVGWNYQPRSRFDIHCSVQFVQRTYITPFTQQPWNRDYFKSPASSCMHVLLLLLSRT